MESKQPECYVLDLQGVVSSRKRAFLKIIPFIFIMKPPLNTNPLAAKASTCIHPRWVPYSIVP